MHKKLNVDSLSSEIAVVNELIAGAQRSSDIIGKIQLEYRLKELTERVKELGDSSLTANNASVALLFGGHPVVGSRGIAAEFAGAALENFQNLVGKIFANNEQGDLGQRGTVPFKVNSELMVTGLARGSFGFVLDEMSGQTQLESSQLTNIIDKAAHMLRDTAEKDETVFEELLEDLDPRTLMALKEFFANLDSNKATIRVVEQGLDFTLDASAVHRAKVRTEATDIEEKTNIIEGILVGFLPEHRKFELRDNQGDIIYGAATKEAVDQLHKVSGPIIGRKCTATVTVKTIAPLNRPIREVVRLIEFLHFED